MKALLVVLSILILHTSVAQAQDLRAFLKNCAWGTLLGAGAGVVSLAFTDKPGDSWGNVAKGASLGLYAGIGVGLYQINKQPDTYQQPDFAMMPQFKDGKLDGVQAVGTLFSF